MSIVKIATPGSGFAKLQELGIADKAVAKYGKSDWLKNAVKQTPEKLIPKTSLVEKVLPQITPVNAWSKR